MKRLAIFDFDGTITYKDSLLEFIKFYKGGLKFYWGLFMLAPVLLLYAIKLIPNWRAKEKVLSYFFEYEDVNIFIAKCKLFSETELPKMIRPRALKAIREHQSNGDRVVVISASAEHWLSFWCQAHQLELIATQLEVKDNKITGRINGFNCYGKEKKARLEAIVNINEYKEIYAYGDSKGDEDILAMATHPFYRHFH